MITFIIALLVLVGGYFLYGSYVERVFGPDKIRKTPALTMADGVDFIPLPTWKIFMIQFLNIAGLGPIFGAIMGAKFGTASYLWIVLGTIFAGAVHDYLSGMLSIRHDGESLPEIIGRYLGPSHKAVDARFYGCADDISRSGFCGRTCRIACQTYSGVYGCYFLDYSRICLLYVGYIVAGR